MPHATWARRLGGLGLCTIHGGKRWGGGEDGKTFTAMPQSTGMDPLVGLAF